jgi:hypothetical protein
MTNQGGMPPGPNEMIEMWRQSASDMEQRWNEFLNQMMGTEAFAQMMARSMDGFASLQSGWTRGMEQYLRALNVPTRADLAELTAHIGVLEQKIDLLTLALGAEHAATISANGDAPANGNGGSKRKGRRRGGSKT